MDDASLAGEWTFPTIAIAGQFTPSVQKVDNPTPHDLVQSNPLFPLLLRTRSSESQVIYKHQNLTLCPHPIPTARGILSDRASPTDRADHTRPESTRRHRESKRVIKLPTLLPVTSATIKPETPLLASTAGGMTKICTRWDRQTDFGTMRLDALGVYLEWASPFLVTEDKERWGGFVY